MKAFIFGAFLVLMPSILIAQATILQQRQLGGPADENPHHFLKLSDENYLVTGFTASEPSDDPSISDISNNYGRKDCWVVKLDRDLNIIWEKTYGGTQNDEGTATAMDNDGQFLVVGTTNSSDIDIPMVNQGDRDAFLMKVDTDGTLLWSQSLGGTFNDELWDVTFDGTNFIAVGHTVSPEIDATIIDREKVWVLKIDPTGDIIWQKTFGGSNRDEASSVLINPDGSIMVAGLTKSDDGDVSFNKGFVDAWLLKLSTDGDLLWEKTYGGRGNDIGVQIKASRNGGYAFLCESNSLDQDISDAIGNGDFWFIKLSENGDLEWEKSIGGAASDTPAAFIENENGDWILLGTTISADPELGCTADNFNLLLYAIDGQTGQRLWSRCAGGSSWDFGIDLALIDDQHLMIAGYTESNDGDLGNGKQQSTSEILHGAHEVWVFELETNYRVNNTELLTPNITLYPNPTKNKIYLNGPENTKLNLQICDLRGSQIQSFEAVSQQSYPLNLQKGLYFVKLCKDGDCQTQKLLID